MVSIEFLVVTIILDSWSIRRLRLQYTPVFLPLYMQNKLKWRYKAKIEKRILIPSTANGGKHKVTTSFSYSIFRMNTGAIKFRSTKENDKLGISKYYPPGYFQLMYIQTMRNKCRSTIIGSSGRSTYFYLRKVSYA